MDARLRSVSVSLGGPAGDLFFALAVVVIGLAALMVVGGASASSAAALAGVLAVVCGCAEAARWVPRVAVSLACPVLFVSAWLPEPAQSIGEAMLLVGVFPLIYRLATRTTLVWSLAGTTLTLCSWQGGALWHTGPEAFNPSIIFGTIGPFVVGLLVRSRTRVRAELESRAAELARAQEQYTAESVRYERNRIARELHDIVAHGLTAMIVQADAGRQLVDRDPSLAAAAFQHIEQSARQSADDIGRLVLLLEPAAGRTRRSIDELIGRARTTGLAIDFRSLGAVTPDDSVTSDTAFAVVQEALTNALKHAPGAAVEVSLCAGADRLTVVVANAPARAAKLELTGTGGGHGLRGLRERLAASGGTLSAHPTGDGGWRVEAELPAAAVGNASE